jgi:hypothetical protein
LARWWWVYLILIPLELYYAIAKIGGNKKLRKAIHRCMLSPSCNLLLRSMRFSIQGTFMTTSAVCYIIYTHIRRFAPAEGVRDSIIMSYIVTWFTSCITLSHTHAFTAIWLFVFFLLGYYHVHETRTVWDFVILHCFGANISGESILKHAASDAFVGTLHAYNWSLSRNIHSV